jgi:hypothetical protein
MEDQKQSHVTVPLQEALTHSCQSCELGQRTFIAIVRSFYYYQFEDVNKLLIGDFFLLLQYQA